MRPKPRLSIITPVLNGARFIEFCVRNVLEQSGEGAEHIIVDGGSTDGTLEIIRQYAEKHPHIRWISEPDKGQSDAMNKGTAIAQGEILGFLNADDYYETGALGEVLSLFHRLPEPTLLVGNCNVWDDNGKLQWISRPAAISLLNLLKGRYEEAFPMNSAAYFYHKSLHERIGPYEVGEALAMDLHFVFKAVQKANVTYVDRVLGNYRYLEGTRTVEDVRSGMNSVRVNKITEHYREQQPLHVKTYLSMANAWERVQRAAHSAYSFARKR